MQGEIKKQDAKFLDVDLIQLIKNTLRILRRVWLPIVLVVALFAVTAVYVQQKTYTPSYKAYCTFSVRVVNKATLNETNSLYSVYYDQDLAKQLDDTFSYMLTSDFFIDEITEYIGDQPVTDSITADSIEGSNIFVLSTFNTTPQKAGALLEKLMEVFNDAARYVVGDMKTEIIEGPVVEDTPCNTPNKVIGIAIGVFLGSMLCMGLVILYAMFRRTVFEPSDLEEHLNMQCFGVVPYLQAKKNLNDNPASVSISHEQGSFRESIRGIARKLENTIERRKVKVILVTSTAAGEGKSILSQNLAESFAYWGKKVVLLDGDFRKPALYRRYGFKNEKLSIEDVLSGEASLDTVLKKRYEDNLTMILNSEVVRKPTVVIDSDTMKEMIDSFKADADIVIIDSPPCGQLSDASIFQQYADGVLFVVEQDRISIHQIVEAAENLCDFENKLLGYVLNGAQKVHRGYGKYGYGKYSYGKYGYGYYGKYGYDNYGESGKHAKHQREELE